MYLLTECSADIISSSMTLLTVCPHRELEDVTLFVSWLLWVLFIQTLTSAEPVKTNILLYRDYFYSAERKLIFFTLFASVDTHINQRTNSPPWI